MGGRNKVNEPEANRRDECVNGYHAGAGALGEGEMLPQGILSESKTLKLRATWSDTGTQAQKTQIHSSNNMAVELPQCTTTHACGHSLKDKV